MATKTATGGLSRITIVAPRTRMDLALPSDVPLADLLPTLLRYAGEDMADVPLLADEYRRNRTTGGFVIIDEATNRTVGAA
ncbi:EsaB/YukD family protein, partial [Micromonospora sp. NPDC047753]|uniref:EsaB/YukD family protein n=1 Tax=Micromonospora sp. NPDC047753 TaxID=3154817 RepID=UPI0033E9C6A1